MNLVEALMQADEKEISKKRTCKYEVSRLSKVFGVPFMLELQEISPKRFSEIQGQTIQIDGSGKTGTDLYKLQELMLCDAITNEEFRKTEVLKKYKVATPGGLYNKLFNVGEIGEIVSEINKLCGINDKKKKTEEVKN